ncbi:MAG: TIGR01777 family oxidoreductase [Acidimicrobiia bacterium]|nr:TIGR01777 family oxidoreductase [Acidimicrobiia bacterium]
MTTKRVVITGASGLIGSGLVTALRERGDAVVTLVRSSPDGGLPPDTHVWGPRTGSLEPSVLRGADAVVVLNGVPIGDKRWNEERKALLLSSRVEAVGTVARTMAKMDDPPPVLVTASAMGIYGDRGDDVLTESEPVGKGFFAELCAAWEAASRPAKTAGIRVVNTRTSLVLSNRGGTLAPMIPLFKLGVGGRIGDGKQWWSWISDEDCIRAFLHVIDNEISGPVNVASPNPVTNREFTKGLGSALRRPTFLPTPRIALNIRLGSELADAVAYVSHRLEPGVLRGSGFTFNHPTIDSALEAALT